VRRLGNVRDVEVIDVGVSSRAQTEEVGVCSMEGLIKAEVRAGHSRWAQAVRTVARYGRREAA
jgi:hypothetical protein